MRTKSVFTFVARSFERSVCGVFAAAVLTFGLAAPARAQCPPAWVPGIGAPGTDGVVSALAVIPDGDLIVGGAFTTVSGMLADRIARVNPTTGAWSPLGAGTDDYVSAVAALPGGDVIVGGGFTSAGGVAANGIARVNPLTNVWTALGSGVSPGGSLVRALAVLPGGDVIVGGFFASAGGVAANNIARYNLTTGVWSALGAGTNGMVNAVAVLPGGEVIVGGTFTAIGGGGAVINRIARYNPTTNVWSALGAGTNGNVWALAVLPGGDLIVGGQFTSAGGVSGTSGIARFNPNTGVWTALGSGVAGGAGLVTALAVLPGGDVIVGGNFATAGGVATSTIARVNLATGVWSALGGAFTNSGFPPYVYALLALTRGEVIVGGEFTTAGGLETSSSIARYSLGASAPSIITQPVPVVTLASNGAVFSCGAAAGAGSTRALAYQWRKGGVAINTITNPSAATPVLSLSNVQGADLGSYDCLVTNSCGGTLSNAATLTFVENACPVDFNADGFLDFFDYADFVEAFEAGC